LGNLVDNALRYTPTGGKIQLSARAVQGKVQLRVQDTGRGIHPDDLPYVFDRFYKADKSRNSSSGKSGLGLAIAKALVLAQKGKIWVESDPVNPGTTFVLEFDPA
jgi:two-component system sensor histidine kinase ResE